MKEYAFDVKLFAVVRVQAENLARARSNVRAEIDCCDLTFHDGLPSVRITEASLSDDHVKLFEVAGEAVFDPEDRHRSHRR